MFTHNVHLLNLKVTLNQYSSGAIIVALLAEMTNVPQGERRGKTLLNII